LTLPQNGCQYILDTDASEHGIGAVLSQIQEGQARRRRRRRRCGSRGGGSSPSHYS